MKILRLLSLLVLVAAASGCSHFDGFASKRADKTYVVSVPLEIGKGHQQIVFHAAYELCRGNHKAGFAIDSQTNRNDTRDEMFETIITCKGPIDATLDKKYGSTKLDLQKSDDALVHGFTYQFRFVPREATTTP